MLLQPPEGALAALAEFFRVFGDPTRLRILHALVGRELSVNEIAAAVGMGQSAVSHQLRILRQTHLVRNRRSGREARYTLTDDHVRTVLEQGREHVGESRQGRP